MYLPEFKCIVFDFAMTLYSGYYFLHEPADRPDWLATIQKVVFTDRKLLSEWCTGKVSTRKIAETMSRHFNMSAEDVLWAMEKGCSRLRFNKNIMRFAALQRKASRKTAIVTVNMDVFSRVVVPAHGLQDKFDVIVNSADHGTEDKNVLWRIAFDKLGNEIGYSNSLLIDDSPRWNKEFHENGGYAYEYREDNDFNQWLGENHLI